MASPLSFPAELVEQAPDITLAELRAALLEAGNVEAHDSASRI